MQRVTQQKSAQNFLNAKKFTSIKMIESCVECCPLFCLQICWDIRNIYLSVSLRFIFTALICDLLYDLI